jgi:TonB family protein
MACASTGGVKIAPRSVALTESPRKTLVEFDTKGADFDQWLRDFTARVRSNWYIPESVMHDKGHVVIAFAVGKDGAIRNVVVKSRSSINSFNNSAYYAVTASNPLAPLPREYPDESAVFALTFYFNESPER